MLCLALILLMGYGTTPAIPPWNTSLPICKARESLVLLQPNSSVRSPPRYPVASSLPWRPLATLSPPRPLFRLCPDAADDGHADAEPEKCAHVGTRGVLPWSPKGNRYNDPKFAGGQSSLDSYRYGLSQYMAMGAKPAELGIMTPVRTRNLCSLLCLYHR